MEVCLCGMNRPHSILITCKFKPIRCIEFDMIMTKMLHVYEFWYNEFAVRLNRLSEIPF